MAAAGGRAGRADDLEDVVLAARVELEEQRAAALLLVLDGAHLVRLEAREERAPLRDHRLHHRAHLRLELLRGTLGRQVRQLPLRDDVRRARQRRRRRGRPRVERARERQLHAQVGAARLVRVHLQRQQGRQVREGGVRVGVRVGVRGRARGQGQGEGWRV